jgi:hypothetical protein
VTQSLASRRVAMLFRMATTRPEGSRVTVFSVRIGPTVFAVDYAIKITERSGTTFEDGSSPIIAKRSKFFIGTVVPHSNRRVIVSSPCTGSAPPPR